ncbi:unnamed protein product [Phytomonas sp. EM1]|nr:unnamed protein product [Phytomonas sp. EM1]|eukprot:CCW62554.1 unnamed protein product [Phytomonas sp. isolate EM1]
MRKDPRREPWNPIKGKQSPFPHGRRVFRGGENNTNSHRNRSDPRNDRSVPRSSAQAPPGHIPIDISFGNFDFQDMKNVGQRGGGMRELASLLRQARRKVAGHKQLLHSREGIQLRNRDLLSAAAQRAAGIKVKDDPQRLAKSIAKRKSKKRQSAKRWAKRVKHLEDSVENVVKDRSNAKNMHRMRREASKKEKAKRREAIKAVNKGSAVEKKGNASAEAKGARKRPSGRGGRK